MYCASLPRTAILLVLVPLTGLLLTTVRDYEWSQALSQLQWQGFVAFMDQSVFEGEPVGASDYPVFAYLFGLALYLGCLVLPRTSMRVLLRAVGGYLVAVGVLVGFALVHLSKGVIGRPRPGVVSDPLANIDFVAWYRFGGEFLHGWGSGSFVSGHTALMSSGLSVVLCVALLTTNQRLQRVVHWLGVSAVLVAGMAMGLARVVGGAHWLSDCFAAMACAWLAVLLMFGWAFQLPAVAGAVRDGRAQALPRLWELRILALAGVAALSVVGVCYAFATPGWPKWGLLPAGLVGLAGSGFGLQQTRRGVTAALVPASPA